MKKNCIVNLIALILVAAFFITGCKSNSGDKVVTHEQDVAKEYTCSMHPQIVEDKPGNCPICGMELVPRHIPGTETPIDSGLSHLLKAANTQVVSNITTVKADVGMKIISMQVQGNITYDTRNQTSIASRVSGRIERLMIKYNYQPVKKGQLIMEIYSPDLAAAQRELLFIYQTDKNDKMLQKAKQKLLLLGMQQNQIKNILNSGKILYKIPIYSNASGYILEKSAVGNGASTTSMPTKLASSNDDGMGMNAGNNSAVASVGITSPVLLREGQYVSAGQSLFTIYEKQNLIAEFFFDPSITSEIKKGQSLIFHKSNQTEPVYSGTIGLIQPTFKAGSQFTLARVYLKGNNFEIGQLIMANIPIVARGWWIPQSAVVNLGNKSIIFKKEKDVFVPKEIKTKMMADGNYLIEEDISDWKIASSAAFMVDSESFIKTNSDNSKKNDHE